MRRVLIVSNNFHSPENIGSVRIRGLANYLPLFGWRPIVLTQGVDTEHRDDTFTIPPPGGAKDHVEANLSEAIGHRPGGLVKHAAELYKEIFWYPDLYHHWRREGIALGRRILLDGEVDAILSSAHSVSSHIIASTLVSEFKVPWVADFRDLWTQNHYFSHLKVRSILERRLEIRTLKNADALVTVSEPMSDKLVQLHRDRPVFTILNGFDPDQLNRGHPLSERFTITYTGNLYRGRRDPTMVFKVLRDLLDEGQISAERISMEFYGKKASWLYDAIEQYGLGDTVQIHGPVSRAESIEKQRTSQLLLLLTWDNPDENGVYTGKLFDYLAARRPILSIGFTDGGVVKALLEDTNAGVHAPDEATVKQILVSYYHDFLEAGAVRFEGIDSRIMNYSQIEMAKRFGQVLDRVSSSRGSS